MSNLRSLILDGQNADKLLNFGLLLFSASCILSITFAEAALILMLAAIIWKAAAAPKGLEQFTDEFHANPLVFPLTLYLVSYIFSSIFSLDQQHSFSRLYTETIKAASALLTFSAVSRNGRDKTAIFFLAGASAAALLGVGQFAAGLLHPAQNGLLRAYGTMHTVSYAEIMAISMLLAGTLINDAGNRYRKLYIATFFVITLGFICSFSRGPTLGLLFGLALVFILRQRSRKFMLIAVCILFIGFSASAVFNKTNRTRITFVTTYLSKKQSISKLDVSAGVRLSMWKAGMAMVRDYPLTGTGPYSVRKVFNYYHHLPVDGIMDFADVHNLYLQRAADSGLPGLMALLFLFGVILKTAISSFKKFSDPFSLWGTAAFCAFILMMCTDSSFDLPRTTFCVYLMAAIAGPAGRQKQGLPQ